MQFTFQELKFLLYNLVSYHFSCYFIQLNLFNWHTLPYEEMCLKLSLEITLWREIVTIHDFLKWKLKKKNTLKTLARTQS